MCPLMHAADSPLAEAQCNLHADADAEMSRINPFNIIMKSDTSNAEDFTQRLKHNLTQLAATHPKTYATLLSVPPPVEISIQGDVPYDVTLQFTPSNITFSAARSRLGIVGITAVDRPEPVYVLLGIDAGYELHELCTRTRNLAPAPLAPKTPVYVVEPEIAHLFAAFSLHDFSEPLRSQRLMFFFGASAVEEMIDYFVKHRQAVPPNYMICAGGAYQHPLAQHCDAAVNAFLRALEMRTRLLENTVSSTYRAFDTQHWRARFAGAASQPLRVFGFTSRFTTFLQYCMRDLLDGFTRSGCVTQLHIQLNDVSRSTKYDILAALDEFQPDLIITIDHFRSENPWLPADVPFVTWIQDLLPSILHPHELTLTRHDHTFVFSKQWIDDLRAQPHYRDHDIRFLPVGLNTSMYYPLADASPQMDVLYVSHLAHASTTLQPFRDTACLFDLAQDETLFLHDGAIDYEKLLLCYMLMIRILDDSLMDKLWRYWVNMEVRINFVKDVLRQAGLRPEQKLINFFTASSRLCNDIHSALKMRPVRALLRSGIDIRAYGRNWEQYGEVKSAACGVAQNGAPLNLLMNQARICLNNSPGASLHMRALEIMGAGSCMLSRRIYQDISPLTDYFTEAEDVVFFNNEIDSVAQTRHYLANESERKRLADNAHRKVVATFGYDVIAKTIIATVAERM